jgi:hypothetical protein
MVSGFNSFQTNGFNGLIHSGFNARGEAGGDLYVVVHSSRDTTPTVWKINTADGSLAWTQSYGSSYSWLANLFYYWDCIYAGDYFWVCGWDDALGYQAPNLIQINPEDGSVVEDYTLIGQSESYSFLGGLAADSDYFYSCTLSSAVGTSGRATAWQRSLLSPTGMNSPYAINTTNPASRWLLNREESAITADTDVGYIADSTEGATRKTTLFTRPSMTYVGQPIIPYDWGGQYVSRMGAPLAGEYGFLNDTLVRYTVLHYGGGTTEYIGRQNSSGWGGYFSASGFCFTGAGDHNALARGSSDAQIRVHATGAVRATIDWSALGLVSARNVVADVDACYWTVNDSSTNKIAKTDLDGNLLWVSDASFASSSRSCLAQRGNGKHAINNAGSCWR